MKSSLELTVASLLSVLLVTFHVADDVAHGIDKATFGSLVFCCVLALWVYATLALGERRSGYVVILIFSLLSLGIAGLHMGGAGIPDRVLLSEGGFFYIWTLFGLATTAFLSILFSIRGLSSLGRGTKS